MDGETTIQLGFRAVQIAVTLYAMSLLYRTRSDPYNGLAGLMLPVLCVLLAFSFISVAFKGRAGDPADMLWWAWTLYDLLLPLAVIKAVHNWRATVRKLMMQPPAAGPRGNPA
jgi:hypothetical protein